MSDDLRKSGFKTVFEKISNYARTVVKTTYLRNVQKYIEETSKTKIVMIKIQIRKKNGVK